MYFRFAFVVFALALSGCFLDRNGTGAQPADDAGMLGRDAGVSADGAVGRDAGPPLGIDAGARDAGAVSPVDAGPVPMDAGADAGEFDAGEFDAGMGIPVTRDLLVHLDAMRVRGGPLMPSDMPTTWVDLSGGNDATCTQVSWDRDGLKPGYPSMFTDGNVGSRCEFPIPDFRDLTIFVVFRNSYTRDETFSWWENAVIVGGDRTGPYDDAALYYAGGNIGFARREAGFQFRDSTSYADDQPHLLAFRRRENGDITLWMDRSADVTTGSSDSGRITQPDHWWLASHQDANNGRFANHYAEVIIYNRGVNDDEGVAVADYLAARWDL